MSVVGLLIGGTVNSAIILYVRSGRGLLSCITSMFVDFLSRKVTATYDLVRCN